MSELVPAKFENRELAAETAVFASYLADLGLPTDNIIAPSDQRQIVATNLHSFLSGLTAAEKSDARYLSKFVGATAIGLFDAALNYVWNEVVLNLRKKVVIYGIDLFYDAAVGGTNRQYYKDEDDLDGLKDIVLLDTCHKLELISGVVYRKLQHILTMRNEVAASHPNVESIGGYELLGWLQTCVKDVLQDRPSESAIRIRSLVDNLKTRTDLLDQQTVQRFSDELRNLSLPHANNLLITLFGIFTSPGTEQVLRNNISQIAPAVWECAVDQVKTRIGTTIDGYRTNLQQERLALGLEFLKLVDGRSFESLPAKLVALDSLAEKLDDVHDSRDNFWHEPPVMAEINTYFRTVNDIPREVLPKLVRVVLRCRIGRGLSYRNGVSPGGKPLYDHFLSLMDDKGIAICLKELCTPEINSMLALPICQSHLETILQQLRALAISDRLKDAIDFVLKSIGNASDVVRSRDFRELTAPIIQWQ